MKPVLDAKAASQEIITNNEKAIWQEEGQNYLWESKKVGGICSGLMDRGACLNL